MAKIKTSSIEDVRARVGVVDIVSQYVNLHRSGSKFKGLSPFKHEKTPSFYVDPAKGMYYCFSTAQGGDIFKFVMCKENLNFPEAVEFIANKFNIRLEYESGGGAARPMSYRKQLFDIHEDTAQWFADQFFADSPEAAEIRDYWVKERGFTLEEARELRIGFAPVSSSPLKKILTGKKYSPDAIIGSGIFYDREGDSDVGNFNPRFRGRITIPIVDIQGRVIAFTARKTRFTPQIPSEEGKYVNSRDTDIFKKNTVVFNIDKAKNAAAEKKYFIVVEGQLDTVRMYCSGFKNTVATQGTAAGAEHFSVMKRFAGKVVLLFDGDSAGRHAALRVIPICFAAGVEPFVALLPPEDDPDSFIKKNGAEAMRDLVENRRARALSFAAREILADIPEPTPQDRRAAMLKLFEIVIECPSQVLRDDYLAEISGALAIEPVSMRADWQKWLERRKRVKIEGTEEDKKESVTSEGILTSDCFVALLICLNFENVAEALSKIVPDAWIVGDGTEERALKRLLALHREDIGFSLDQIETTFDDAEERNLIYKISLEDKEQIDNPIKYANKCAQGLFRRYLQNEKNTLIAKLARADFEGTGEKFEIMKRLAAIAKEGKNPPAKIEKTEDI